MGVLRRLRPLRRRLLNGMSALGERWGVEWLIYNPFLFAYYDRRARGSAPSVIKHFERMFPSARQLADVGAGSGAFAAHARARGHTVVACEYSRLGRWLGRARGVGVRPFDLTSDPPADLEGPIDLAYCFEIAEHVDPALGDRLVEFLSNLAPTIVFTAAHPGQGGTGHINEQPAGYWIERFEQNGMRHRQDLSEEMAAGLRADTIPAWWLTENIMIFERADEVHREG